MISANLERYLKDNLPPGFDLEKQMAGFSKDQLVEIERAMGVVERREREERSRYYEPYDNLGYQLDFHRCLKKRRLVLGSNRSGKSIVARAEVNWWATETHPYRKTPKPPVRIRWCCTDFLNGIEKVALPGFKEWVKREDLQAVGKTMGNWEEAYSKEHRTLYYRNGSFVEFMSYDQDVEKFGGASRHLIVEDEPAPQDIHIENEARLVDTGGDLIMPLTPVNLGARTSWIYDLWLEISAGKRPEWASFHFDIYKNRSLTKDFIDAFSAGLSEAERMARIGGRFAQLLGLVFKEFNRAKHVIPQISQDRLLRDYSVYIGCDPHPKRECAVPFLAVDKYGTKIIFDEIFEAAHAKVIVDKIKQKLDKIEPALAVMDDYGSTENVVMGDVSMWQLFLDPDQDGSDRGIYFHLASGANKSINGGIELIKQGLGLDEIYQRPSLFVTENCVHMIHELETWIWGNNNKPVEENNHLIAGIRYILSFNPVHMTGKFNDPSKEYVYDQRTGGIIR
jgi:phage terminase large subunit-like protein